MRRGREGRVKEREEVEGKIGQGKGELDLDICPGALEFLVMPLIPTGA